MHWLRPLPSTKPVHLSTDALRGLRMALLAPISWPCPPPGYGPWEQVAFDIADGMRRRGLDVTLFATGNAQFAGKISSVVPVGIEEDPGLNGDIFTAIHIGELFSRADDFDLIHNNLDWKPLTYALATKAPPMITTIHGFSSPQILAAYYAGARRSFFCSISDSDRDPGLQYLATTYNGVDASRFDFSAIPGEYLVFLGRFHPEKGAHRAIAAAKRAGVRIILAGIPHDRAYFDECVAPEIDGDAVRFIGAVQHEARNALLGGALALVHLTTRPERFGLVLIEAMACGTPILGARMGSIPEIVVDGVTGILCDDDAAAVAAIPRLAQLDRAACRAHVEAKFSNEAMIDRYLDAYALALAQKLPPAPTPEQQRWRKHDWWDRPMGYTDIGETPRSLGFD